MGADLHIHILKGVTEEVLARFQSNVLGSGYWQSVPYEEHRAHRNEDYDAISATPNIWVGEVSWLKAAVYNDGETYVPGPVGAVSEAIQGLVTIDDELILKIAKGMGLENKTMYQTTGGEKVLAFLEKHKGEKAFTISW